MNLQTKLTAITLMLGGIFVLAGNSMVRASLGDQFPSISEGTLTSLSPGVIAAVGIALLALYALTTLLCIRPVHKLAQGIKAQLTDHQYRHIDVYTSDEAGQIAKAYNRIVDEVTELRVQVNGFDDDLRQAVISKTEELEAENSKVRGIIENTTDWIAAIDLDFRFIAFNRAYAHQFKRLYAKTLAVSMHLLDDALSHFPEERLKQRELWARALAGEEFTITQELGSEEMGQRIYEVSFHPIRDEHSKPMGASQLWRDVTERKKAENDLLRAKQRIEQEVENVRKFELAVAASTDSIAITDDTGKPMYVNAAWLQITGLAQTDALHTTIPSLLSSEANLKIISDLTSAIAAHAHFHSDDLSCTRGIEKTQFFAEITLYPIVKENMPTLFVAILHDITQRKRVERAQSEFVSLASHQLRTPLTAIRLVIGALQRGEAGQLTPDGSELVKRSMEYIVNMAETIHTMLNISRLEAGKLTIKPADILLLPFLQQIVSDYKLETERRKQTLSLECPDTLTIRSDTPLLKEVIGNLVNNAIKYTPEGGTIGVTARTDNQRIIMTVRDSGYGIPVSEQPKIFTKFFRAENVVKRETSGTGLGLYLVKSLVDFLHGTISFTSLENEGTTFTISLPLTIL